MPPSALAGNPPKWYTNPNTDNGGGSMVWTAERGDAYALLAALLAEQGISPLPPMARTQRGKPYFPGRPEVCFNLSHSHGWALCAVSEKAVGCDIEVVRPRRPGLPRHVLSGAECAWFEERGSRWEDFFTLWTLKEARVKCTGEGLVLPARDIAVPPITPGETAELDGFTFTALEGGGWRGAVCQRERI